MPWWASAGEGGFGYLGEVERPIKYGWGRAELVRRRARPDWTGRDDQLSNAFHDDGLDVNDGRDRPRRLLLRPHRALHNACGVLADRRAQEE